MLFLAIRSESIAAEAASYRSAWCAFSFQPCLTIRESWYFDGLITGEFL